MITVQAETAALRRKTKSSKLAKADSERMLSEAQAEHADAVAAAHKLSERINEVLRRATAGQVQQRIQKGATGHCRTCSTRPNSGRLGVESKPDDPIRYFENCIHCALRGPR